MSTYRAHEGPRPTQAHHRLMAALVGVTLGAGFLVAGASVAAGVEAQPYCSEYDVPDTVAPVEVPPPEVTIPVAPVTPAVVVPAETSPTTTQPTVPVTVAPADVAAPVPTVAPAVVPSTTLAPEVTPASETSVLGEVVVNDQGAPATLPVTGLPTAALLSLATALLLVGESMRRVASRRRNAAMAAADLEFAS